MALFNPEMSNLIQKRHPYTGNVNSETPGDSETAFLHWGDTLGSHAGLLVPEPRGRHVSVCMNKWLNGCREVDACLKGWPRPRTCQQLESL